MASAERNSTGSNSLGLPGDNLFPPLPDAPAEAASQDAAAVEDEPKGKKKAKQKREKEPKAKKEPPKKEPKPKRIREKSAAGAGDSFWARMAKADPYNVALAVACAALSIGSLLLLLELTSYGFAIKP